jgi:Na+/melibiose symporter-like transporter
MALYSAASIGCGAFFSFNNYVLPLYLQAFTHSKVLLGLMGSTHSIEGAVIQPIIGTMSDNTRSALGRRRPFMLIFFILSALLLWATPLLGSLPIANRLWLIVGTIFLFTLAFNIAFDPYQALMPDITPVAQRGRVTAVWAMLGLAAQAAILPLNGLFHVGIGAIFTLVAVLMIATNLTTCGGIRETPYHGPKTRRTPFKEIGAALQGFSTLRQAAIAMGVSGLAGAGLGVVTPFLTLFIKSVTGCNDGQAMLSAFILLIASMVFVLPFGHVVDRIGSKRTLYIAFVALALACILALGIHTLAQVYVVMGLAGFGNAARSAAEYPLLTEVVPEEEVGVYTGFQTTMLSIAQPVTVAITGSLIEAGSYRIVFLVCGIAIALSMVVLRSVNVQRAQHEVAARRLIRERA